MPQIELLPAKWPAISNIFAAATIRRSGCSKDAYANCNLAGHVGDAPERVAANRELLAASLDFQADFQWLRQVHGNRVATVSTAGAAPEADALVTRTPGIALCVLTADCLPVFLASREGGEAAVIHAGWRGLSAGIVENTLAAMQTPPTELLAWLGPAILACHYETGEDVRQVFLERVETAAESKRVNAAFTPLPAPGKYLADLVQIAKIKLQAIGITNITGGKHCTHCDAERFFSHRRDGLCGRMANLICIRPPR